MEIKKSLKVDLQNKRRIFFLIGIIVALAVIIALFSWSQSSKVIDNVALTGNMVDPDVVATPVTPDKPTEPVKIEPIMVSDLLKIVKDDKKIDVNIDPFIWENGIDLTKIKVKTFTSTHEKGVDDDDVPVLVAEENPKFQGGDINVFRAWCGKNLEYPSIASENGIQGTVYLAFVVERDGSLTNVKVERGVDRELDAAAIKVVSSSPKWTPGKNRGKPVRFAYRMPVQFVLTQ